MTSPLVRSYLVVDLDPLRGLYEREGAQQAACEIRAVLAPDLPGIPFEIVALPSRASLGSRAWYLQKTAVVAIETSADDVAGIRPRGLVREVGRDDRIHPTRHWCPGRDGRRFFGDRRAALQLIGADGLSDLPSEKPASVRVAVFDTGLVPSDARQNVWSAADGALDDEPKAASPPAEPDARSHGAATARQVASLAPGVAYWDYRILAGDRLRAPAAFVSGAIAAYQHLAASMLVWQGPWVAVNAWSLFDRALDPGREAAAGPVALYDAIAAVEEAGADVVFAAGNCGEFCTDPRCARGTRGPGSILGVASLPSVLSVAAVRCDGIWIGSSSEGLDGADAVPGVAKPDLSAPSGFAETGDAALLNTGTSTACALVAGAIAALRRAYPDPPPALMRAVLRETARPSPGVPRRRIGAGILDVAAARARLAGP
ncbi:S8 family serine peptidase [Salinarimonas sp.]|uniref:S8 family serine peptidase n=1 Tax=Salinarimonas sp. TaxID=2766526 RepID=UPI00391B7353